MPRLQLEHKYRRTNDELFKKAGTTDFRHIDERALMDRRVLDRTLQYIQDPNLLPEQRTVLQAFRDDYVTRGDVRPSSIASALLCTYQLAKAIQKPFLMMEKADINAFISNISQEQGYTERTRIHKNVHLKYFFKWLYAENSIEHKGQHPPLVEHLSTMTRDRGVIHAQDLISPVDVRHMVESCDKLRDKALLMTLYEAGCRARELLSLKIGDLTIETHSIDMRIRQGKTGARTNTLIDSYPYLCAYLNTHPFKNDRDAPLFINLSRAQWGRQFQYQGLGDLVRIAAQRAGITKRVHPHLFRHSRATELACSRYAEPQLRLWFGWSRTSSTPSIYVHVAQSDLKKQILRDRGLLGDDESVEDAEKRVALQPKLCPRCNKQNSADALACNCGMALSVDAAEKMRSLREQSDNFMDKVNSLPLRPHLIGESTKPRQYRENLVRSDPLLREEFRHIAREVMTITQPPDLTEGRAIVKNPVTNKNRDAVIKLRAKGLAMQEIASILSIGYGTVREICASKE